MQNVIIFGASGHGSVVLDCIEKEGKYNVIGFIDSFKKKGTLVFGYEVLGSEYDLPYLTSRYKIFGGIVAIGDNWVRKLIVDRITKVNPNFSFINTIHPSASVSKNVLLGCGTAIMPGVVVNANSVINNFCILNTNSSLDHDSMMQSYSSLAPGVCTGGNVNIGKFSAICLGANITSNITIGAHTLVGAGSLVLNDLGVQIIAFGSPAIKIRSRMIGEPYLSSIRKRKKTIPLKYS